jgi:hypothetical protein
VEKKKYRIVNTSTYTKRLILGSQTEQVPAKGAVELELTEKEFALARRSPDILVSEVDTTPKKLKQRNNKLNRDEHFQGRSGTVAPRGDENHRPLYEHFMVEVFGLKSRIAVLEARNAELEAMMKSVNYDSIYAELQEQIHLLQQKVNSSWRPTGGLAPSELLNVDNNPQESRRAVFEKIVEKNKEIRT